MYHVDGNYVVGMYVRMSKVIHEVLIIAMQHYCDATKML